MDEHVEKIRTVLFDRGELIEAIHGPADGNIG
jgi:hypothetical protein